MSLLASVAIAKHSSSKRWWLLGRLDQLIVNLLYIWIYFMNSLSYKYIIRSSLTSVYILTMNFLNQLFKAVFTTTINFWNSLKLKLIKCVLNGTESCLFVERINGLPPKAAGRINPYQTTGLRYWGSGTLPQSGVDSNICLQSVEYQTSLLTKYWEQRKLSLC